MSDQKSQSGVLDKSSESPHSNPTLIPEVRISAPWEPEELDYQPPEQPVRRICVGWISEA
jgi:hypothetical protein